MKEIINKDPLTVDAEALRDADINTLKRAVLSMRYYESQAVLQAAQQSLIQVNYEMSQLNLAPPEEKQN